MNQTEVLIDIRAVLGEGPSWDEKESVLYFTDILEKRVYKFSPADGSLNRYAFPQYVGAVVPRQSGGLAVAAQDGIYAYDPDSGSLKPIGLPENPDPDLRFNDGKCDPMGRFWAGTTSLSDRAGASFLYRLNAEGRLDVMLEGVSISNGLCWNRDGTVMYYIDTPTRTVSAFDFEMETGSIRNRRTAIEIPESEGAPDGMTIDEEGKLWIAHWGGFQVARWDPATGRKLASVRLPVPLVTSCVFGGSERNELFITTARIGLSEDELRAHPLSGAVFRVAAGVKGAETHRYLG
jgi:sugar lactone lactonase YvrE